MRNKQTKIIATVAGDISLDLLKELHNNGMDAVRINTAHQPLETAADLVNRIREASPSLAIIIDTKGPEVRTRLVNGELALGEGSTVVLNHQAEDAVCNEQYIPLSFPIADHIKTGDHILIDDGEINLRVIGVQEQDVHAIVIQGGILRSRKSVNIPHTKLPVPSLSEKDKQYIQFAKEHNIEFIAHSFVRNIEDVRAVQEAINQQGGEQKIIAKIENQEGYDNLRTILPEVYGVMVARGDLGVEIPYEEIPVLQKEIIKLCIHYGKPVITATQMLQSMIKHPRPTRAEVSDVANAIYDGTDAVMLSGETAYGKYPVQAVKTMSLTAKEVEKHKKPYRKNDALVWEDKRHEYFGRQAIQACQELPIKGIIALTWTGATARLLSTFRGKIPIYAKCSNQRTTKELAIVYGVYPHEIEPQDTTDKLIATALKDQDGICKPEHLLAILGTAPGKEYGIDFLEINTYEDALKGRT